MAAQARIAPSILSADLAHMARDLDAISGADLIHIDVMDGHFTGNLTFGVEMVRMCKRISNVPVDVHMMVTNPDETALWYADAGADYVTVHIEAATHLHRIIKNLQDRGVKAGVVLNPATPVCSLESIIEDVDMVLVMSVDPGFGGQSYIPGTDAKLRQLRTLCAEHGVSPLIEVDGGVSAKNVRRVCAAGADVVVAGSAVFGSADPAAEIVTMRELGTQGIVDRDA